MADSTIGVNEGTNTNLDAESLTVGSNTVKRQRIQLTGAAATDVAPVYSVNQGGSGTYGLSVRLSPPGQATQNANEVAVTSGSGTTIGTAATGQRLIVGWLSVSVSSTTIVNIYSGIVGSAKIFTFRSLANTTMFFAAPTGWYLLRSALSDPLTLDVSTSCTVNFALAYYHSTTY